MEPPPETPMRKWRHSKKWQLFSLLSCLSRFLHASRRCQVCYFILFRGIPPPPPPYLFLVRSAKSRSSGEGLFFFLFPAREMLVRKGSLLPRPVQKRSRNNYNSENCCKGALQRCLFLPDVAVGNKNCMEFLAFMYILMLIVLNCTVARNSEIFRSIAYK